MPDVSGQAVGTRRWAQSASAAFLAKRLLAWVPLERRLRGSVLLSLFITEPASPFRHGCSGRERATSDSRERAACLLQSGESPAVPTERVGGRWAGSAEPVIADGLPRGGPDRGTTCLGIHSLRQSFIHLGMCSRGWGYSSEQDRQGPCPPS